MKEINEYIKIEAKEYKRKSTLHSEKSINNKKLIKKMTEDYNQWLSELKTLMNNKLYRQTLKVIEADKYKFELIKTELWKYRLIKAKAILKIIKIKMRKYQKVIILENTRQNLSLKFWFNQIFLILEELNLEFRYDLNKNMNYKSKQIIEPVQTLVEYHLEFIYYLCIYSFRTNEIIQLISYLAIANKFLPYIHFFSKKKLLNLFQNIILFKIKILVENFEFLPVFTNLKIFFKLCFREMHLFFDFDSPIDLDYLNDSEDKNKSMNGFYQIIQKIILAYYLRGVACEHLGFFKMSICYYKRCRWFTNRFLYNYNKVFYKFFRSIRKRYSYFKEIVDDINNLIKYKNANANKNNGNKENDSFINRNAISSFRSRIYKEPKPNNIINRNKSVIFSSKNPIRLRTSFINDIKKKEKLENFLESIGNTLYKEEENKNNSIFKKFTVNSFVLSTVNMIDNLFSNSFSHILKKMEKVEITKPKEDINELINLTINYKRQKKFKEEMEKMNKKSNIKKKFIRSNSCINININLNNSLNKSNYFKPNQLNNSNITIIKEKEKEISKDDELQNVEKEKSFFNDNLKLNFNNIKNINKINSYDKALKLKFSSFRNTQNKTNSNSNSQRINKKVKILKYPLYKNVFSKSLLNKKYYLDSIYEKELNFQKKLLKLKGCDIEKVTKNFNQQKIKKSAELEFQIIKSTAQSKNKKKNLINLVKNNEYQNIGHMFPEKLLRGRSNKKQALKDIKKYMLLNNISNTKERFDPNNVSKYNEEKTKKLNVECSELEKLQNKYRIQRKMLINKGINKKRYDKIY